jgi:peptidoglycan hydrolase-like protein with peptidoglycan-binding domain
MDRIFLSAFSVCIFLVPLAAPVFAQNNSFNRDLYYGLKKDRDVMLLQKTLKAEGCFKETITGNFGALTMKAVECFQKKHKFTSLSKNGYVGTYTRKVLNEVLSKANVPVTAKKSNPATITPAVIAPAAAPTEESIIFALNKRYADIIPEWEQKVSQFFQEINAVYAKTTKKRFIPTSFKVFQDNQFYDITTRPEKYPEFYHDFNGKGGITYFYVVTPQNITITEAEKMYGLPTGHGAIGTAASAAYDGRITYPIVFSQASEQSNIFNTAVDYYQNVKNGFLHNTIHELGHQMGLAVPDWYLYQYSDCTGVEPKFSDYDIQQDPYFKDDPMVSAGTIFGVSTQFNEVNSAIINRNLDRRYDFSFIETNWYSKVSKVHVTDNLGNPVQGATVKVFPVLESRFYTFTDCKGAAFGHGVPSNPAPEQVVMTDKNGYVAFNGPVGLYPSDSYMVKALKASWNGKTSAATVSFLDLQKNFVLHNSNEYIIEMRL